MSASWLATAILAQMYEPEKLKALGRGFLKQSSETTPLAWLAVVVAAVGLFIFFRLCRQRPAEEAERVTHLAESVHALGLRPEVLDDLRTVAGRAAMTHPTAMLLSPANLARAARAAQARTADPVLQERLDQLSLKLFGKHLADCDPTTQKDV